MIYLLILSIVFGIAIWCSVECARDNEILRESERSRVKTFRELSAFVIDPLPASRFDITYKPVTIADEFLSINEMFTLSNTQFINSINGVSAVLKDPWGHDYKTWPEDCFREGDLNF